ncbi:hypothetical protein ACFLZN_01425 [Nanoarchaeota archaeon]
MDEQDPSKIRTVGRKFDTLKESKRYKKHELEQITEELGNAILLLKKRGKRRRALATLFCYYHLARTGSLTPLTHFDDIMRTLKDCYHKRNEICADLPSDMPENIKMLYKHSFSKGKPNRKRFYAYIKGVRSVLSNFQGQSNNKYFLTLRTNGILLYQKKIPELVEIPELHEELHWLQEARGRMCTVEVKYHDDKYFAPPTIGVVKSHCPAIRGNISQLENELDFGTFEQKRVKPKVFDAKVPPSLLVRRGIMLYQNALRIMVNITQNGKNLKKLIKKLKAHSPPEKPFYFPGIDFIDRHDVQDGQFQREFYCRAFYNLLGVHLEDRHVPVRRLVLTNPKMLKETRYPYLQYGILTENTVFYIVNIDKVPKDKVLCRIGEKKFTINNIPNLVVNDRTAIGLYKVNVNGNDFVVPWNPFVSSHLENYHRRIKHWFTWSAVPDGLIRFEYRGVFDALLRSLEDCIIERTIDNYQDIEPEDIE